MTEERALLLCDFMLALVEAAQPYQSTQHHKALKLAERFRNTFNEKPS